jgi:hypothetical protein
MSDEQPQSVPVDVGDLDLIDHDDDVLEQDASAEAAAEAGMTDEGVTLAPSENVNFEEDDSGVAR